MYRIWYWAMIGRESNGRFVASVPDLGDVAAWGETDKDAIAHVASLAAERVRTLVDRGEQVPPKAIFLNCQVTLGQRRSVAPWLPWR
jgi:predicted RNase H-like HicB family nuclease